MTEPAMLWPWPWWSVPIACAAIVFVAWATARLSNMMKNRRTTLLGQRLRDAGLDANEAYALVGGRNAAVISGHRLAVVDTRRGQVVQTLDLDETVGLKIYEGAEATIGFRFLGRNGSQSRKILTRSTPEFTRLFGLMASAAKRIEYIEEA